MHVKGRIVEAGLAGCCVLDMRGSPTADWFEPGRDYLEYSTADEAADIIERMKLQQVECAMMGLRLRRKILDNHTPAHFWRRILDRIGVCEKAA
jgi:hypothetical protein